MLCIPVQIQGYPSQKHQARSRLVSRWKTNGVTYNCELLQRLSKETNACMLAEFLFHETLCKLQGTHGREHHACNRFASLSQRHGGAHAGNTALRAHNTVPNIRNCHAKAFLFAQVASHGISSVRLAQWKPTLTIMLDDAILELTVDHLKHCPFELPECNRNVCAVRVHRGWAYRPSLSSIVREPSPLACSWRT